MCVALVASLTEEMAMRSIAYHAHGTADCDKYSAVMHGLCVMILNQHVLLAQARPHNDKSSD